MASSWSELAHCCRGAVYPVNLTQHSNTCSSDDSARTLVELCSDFIVKDAATTDHAIRILPAELCLSLLQAALMGDRALSLNVLVSHWPMEVLSIAKLTPKLFSSLLCLYDTTHGSKMVYRGVQCTTSLVQSFTGCLKERALTKLKYLDLTGLVTADLITRYLATHCMLAHNERRQKEVIAKYNNVVQLLSEYQKGQLYKMDESLPDGSCYAVKFDAFVNDRATHHELCKALMISSFITSAFRIYLNKLDATHLGEVKLKILLDQVNAKHLTSLCLQFNSLGEHGILYIAPSISALKNLVALDLSCNGIYFYHNQNACDVVAQMLASLPHLTRLDLSNNRLKTRLRQLLSNISQSLEYLCLVGCCLAISDMTYLSISHHLTALRELDLSENSCVGQNCRALVKLVTATQKRLVVLELQNCSLQDSHCLELQLLLPYLKELKYLNLCCNPFSQGVSASCIRICTHLVGLRAINLSFPIEFHEADDEVPTVFLKSEFAHQMRNFIKEQDTKSGHKLELLFNDI